MKTSYFPAHPSSFLQGISLNFLAISSDTFIFLLAFLFSCFKNYCKYQTTSINFHYGS